MPKDNHSIMQYYLDGPTKIILLFYVFKNFTVMKLLAEKVLKQFQFLQIQTI